MDPRKRDYGVEWPTLGLVAMTYALWLALVMMPFPLWLSLPLLAITLTLHSSLQHEAIHGHPLPSHRLSELLLSPGLGLAVPYGRFRDLHLAHHKDSNLTDPYDDPESNYYDPPQFEGMSPAMRRLLEVNNTLLGRFILGPAIGMKGFFRTEWQLICAGSARVRAQWTWHLASVAVVVAVIAQYGAVPLWAYVIAAYLALSVLKIRTFVEHQAHEQASGRSVIIEDRGPLAFLFLNNNLHSVHHAHPGVAWYDLPRLYRSRREAYLARNRGYHFTSYGEVARRFLMTPKDPVAHPFRGRER